jgi:hypothetical protein
MRCRTRCAADGRDRLAGRQAGRQTRSGTPKRVEAVAGGARGCEAGWGVSWGGNGASPVNVRVWECGTHSNGHFAAAAGDEIFHFGVLTGRASARRGMTALKITEACGCSPRPPPQKKGDGAAFHCWTEEMTGGCADRVLPCSCAACVRACVAPSGHPPQPLRQPLEALGALHQPRTARRRDSGRAAGPIVFHCG